MKEKTLSNASTPVERFWDLFFVALGAAMFGGGLWFVFERNTLRISCFAVATTFGLIVTTRQQQRQINTLILALAMVAEKVPGVDVKLD